MRAVRVLVRAALAGGAFVAVEARAQVVPADSVRAARADSVEVAPGAALPVAPAGPAAPAQPLLVLGPAEPPAGRPATPRPSETAALDVQAILAERPGAFGYALAAPGRWGGVAVDGLAPDAPALRLDGRPLDDLFTGAPRLDLLPAELVRPLRLADAALGRPLALEASLPDFRGARPRTELRYLAGRPGVQHVAATHAQTRRAPGVLGGAAARVTGTFHVASRTAASPVAGGTGLRHTSVLARLALARVGVDAEAGVLHTDRTEGPRSQSFFSPALGPSRRSLRTELWTTLRARALGSAPAALTLAATDQRAAFVAAPGDTARAEAVRLSAMLAQPVGRAALRAEVFADGLASGGVLGEGARRLAFGAALRDTLALGRAARLAAEGGATVWGGAVLPVAALRLEAGAAGAGLRVGGVPASRLEARGWADRLAPQGDPRARRVLATDAHAQLGRGPLALGVRAFGHAEGSARRLVSVGDSALAALTSEGLLTRLGATLSVGVRDAARRGVYARAGATAQASPGSSPLARREDAALPRLWATARVGSRVVGVGGDVLDLDVALDALAWTAFAGRTLDAATSALVLPDLATPRVPARAVVGAEATAVFRVGARLFVRLDHALGGLYAARIAPGETLAPAALRAGVSWTLLD